MKACLKVAVWLWKTYGVESIFYPVKRFVHADARLQFLKFRSYFSTAFKNFHKKSLNVYHFLKISMIILD